MKIISDSKGEPVLFTAEVVGSIYQCQGLLREGRIVQANEVLDGLLRRFGWDDPYRAGQYGERYTASVYQVIHQELEQK